MSQKNHYGYTRIEEIANFGTHGVGLLFSIVGFVLLIVAALGEGFGMLFSFTIYGLSLVALYFSSTMYHFSKNLKRKRIFQIFDHCCIFLLIAGTYTPFMILALDIQLGMTVLMVIWTLAFLGILMTLSKSKKFKSLRIQLCVVMGWLVLLASNQMVSALPWNAILWLLAGGVFYSLGIIAYLLKSLHLNHALWHLFVMAGSASHFISIYFYLS